MILTGDAKWSQLVARRRSLRIRARRTRAVFSGNFAFRTCRASAKPCRNPCRYKAKSSGPRFVDDRTRSLFACRRSWSGLLGHGWKGPHPSSDGDDRHFDGRFHLVMESRSHKGQTPGRTPEEALRRAQVKSTCDSGDMGRLTEIDPRFRFVITGLHRKNQIRKRQSTLIAGPRYSG